MQRVDPLTYRDWNEHVLATPQASIFHSTNWLRVLQASYGYQPYYLAGFKGQQLTALLPFMEVKSWITGVRGVSLPFSDYCEPISDASTPYLEILAQVILVARRQKWKSIEMRGGDDLLYGISPYTFYYRHLLMLQKDEAEIASSLRSNYRARIKKARANDLTVTILRSAEAMTAYYRLHCLTRKRQGLPPQPVRFFQHIQEHIIANNFGFVALVSHHGTHVAGGVFFYFGHRVIYKFGATDRRYQSLYPTHLLLWHVIQWLCHHGYAELCFGRSAPNNTGLIQFKDGWGANKSRINYYRYNLKTASFVQDVNHWSESSYKVCQKIPITLLKLAGSVLYKHMG